MEVNNYLAVLARRKSLIILTLALTVLVVLVGLLLSTPTYEASTTMRVLTARTGSREYIQYDVIYTERLMDTYAQLATSGPVRQQVAQQLGIAPLPTISAAVVPNTELMEITAEGSDPVVAASAANAVAEVLIGQTEALSATTGQATSVMVVEPATVPEKPSSPNWTMMLVLAAVAGLAGGAGLAFLLDRLDTRLYTPEQAEAASGSPLLATIPDAGPTAANVFADGSAPAQEAYRQLGARIDAMAHRDGLRTLLVTSAEPDEGKSAVVSNLAWAMAQAGHRVLAVDANLRRPTLHHILGVSNKTGLSNILERELELPEADRYSNASGVWVVPSGPVHSGPVRLLASRQMGLLIETMSSQFDIVLLDSPAILSVADVAMLAPRVDGVVLVVRRGQTRREKVRAAAKRLADVGATLVGVVFETARPGRQARRAETARQAERRRKGAPADLRAQALYPGTQLRVPPNSIQPDRVTKPTGHSPDSGSGQ